MKPTKTILKKRNILLHIPDALEFFLTFLNHIVFWITCTTRGMYRKLDQWIKCSSTYNLNHISMTYEKLNKPTKMEILKKIKLDNKKTF